MIVLVAAGRNIGRPTGMKIDLSGRRTVVTGGSRGIGRAIALGLAEAGRVGVGLRLRCQGPRPGARRDRRARGCGARAGLRHRRSGGAVGLYRRGRRRRSAASTSWCATPRGSALATTRPAGSAASMSICSVRRARSGRPCRISRKAAAAPSSIFHRSRGSAPRPARPLTARCKSGDHVVHTERSGRAGDKGHPGQLRRTGVDRISLAARGSGRRRIIRGFTARSCAVSRSAGSAIQRRSPMSSSSSPRRSPTG